jgi:hypothetical protein
MAEQLYKLSPDRDLQSYFLMPSAIAAMSNATANGFTVSGKWRQQFDWAVVEWNRDNVFEHPSLRCLPDGDLSGLTLSYIEERTGCIPFESNLFPVVDWHNLRIWAPPPPDAIADHLLDDGTTEVVYHVDFTGLITPIGNYVPASAKMTVVASPGDGQRIGVAMLETHVYYTTNTGDDLPTIASGVASAVNLFSDDFSAQWHGDNSFTLTWKTGPTLPRFNGANGNRITVYGFSQVGPSVWAEPAVLFSGGQFPGRYQVNVNFGSLAGYYFDASNNRQTVTIPTTQVRKLRWTWSADLQPNRFQQTEFQVNISQWTVTGSNRQYVVAGPGSRRIEDTDLSIQYSGNWSQPPALTDNSSVWPMQSGNYSNSKIHFSRTTGDSCTITYSETATHQLYLGTRFVEAGSTIGVSIDGLAANNFSLTVPGEDVLVRIPLGAMTAGTHTITIQNLADARFFFDFLEIAYPSAELPEFDPQPTLSLATDWDTYHSQSLPAERTAWLIHKLGFHGRVNHYVGALWFYEIVRTGTQYASLTLTLTLTTDFENKIAILDIASGESEPVTPVQHLLLTDDRPETVASAYAGLLNAGTNLVWASAQGNQLTIVARSMGTLGNGIVVNLDLASQGLVVTAPSTTLSGGIDGDPYDLASDEGGVNDTLMAAAQFWRTDLTATPRLNRAARDWHAAYYHALNNYGLDVVAAFSTELMNVDPAPATKMAQRYPDGSAVVLNTPAIQTNFSPIALQYWTQVYLDMAGLQQAAGLIPYLQSGEVQWWYFPKPDVGMTFYDAFTKQQFAAQYGVAIQTITTNDPDNLDPYANEIAFLPTLIGNYTAYLRGALQTQFPNCRYEVLYPNDVNATSLNRLINYPSEDWTPGNLTCLKTESFGFTGGRDLDSSTQSMSLGAAKGFLNTQRSHLVGIGDAWTAWTKEVDVAQSQGLESVVLFALDQYCLIGYPPAPFVKLVRSQRQG